MLAIDLALLAGGALLLVVAAGLVGGRVSQRREQQRRRASGARNAQAEKARLDEHCAVCGGAVDPANDLWDDGRWWHRACFRELMRQDP